jgi:hypothetical protein
MLAESKNCMAKVKIGLRGLTTQQKLDKARSIEQKLAVSQTVDKQVLPIGALVKAANMLEKAITMAEFGDKRALAARQMCEKYVEVAMRNVGVAIEHASGQNGNVIEACGYEVRSTNNRSTPITKPEGLEVKRLEKPGSIVLKWNPVPNSKSYLVQTSTQAPNKNTNWQTSGFSTRSRCTLDALKLGTTYWFRILAIGAKGIGPPSASVKKMAA